MSTPRRLPIDDQTFEQIRTTGAIYVDKTHYIEKLLSIGRFFFLSRPHRFGKSLFTSTLKAYFEGKKELFDGLFLEHGEPELAAAQEREAWIKYPVLHLDLNTEEFTNIEELEKLLVLHLSRWDELYGKKKR